jgi:hypothetical protein
MNTDEATMKMKAKLDAFFDTATRQDISALLSRTNYEFYKNVSVPEEAWFDMDFAVTETNQVLTVEVPAIVAAFGRVSNQPIVSIGRSHPADHESLALAADHQDLALAA